MTGRYGCASTARRACEPAISQLHDLSLIQQSLESNPQVAFGRAKIDCNCSSAERTYGRIREELCNLSAYNVVHYRPASELTLSPPSQSILWPLDSVSRVMCTITGLRARLLSLKRAVLDADVVVRLRHRRGAVDDRAVGAIVL